MRGKFNFSNNTTADPNNPANLATTGNSFASYLLGIVDSGDRTVHRKNGFAISICPATSKTTSSGIPG